MFLKVNQNLPLSVKFEDAKGNEATVDGAPIWAVSDEALAKLEVAEDGLSALLIPSGKVGSFKVQCTADGDMGEGSKSIMGEMDIDLLPADAVKVGLIAGEPVDQKEEAPVEETPVEEPVPAPVAKKGKK